LAHKKEKLLFRNGYKFNVGDRRGSRAPWLAINQCHFTKNIVGRKVGHCSVADLNAYVTTLDDEKLVSSLAFAENDTASSYSTRFDINASQDGKACIGRHYQLPNLKEAILAALRTLWYPGQNVSSGGHSQPGRASGKSGMVCFAAESGTERRNRNDGQRAKSQPTKLGPSVDLSIFCNGGKSTHRRFATTFSGDTLARYLGNHPSLLEKSFRSRGLIMRVTSFARLPAIVGAAVSWLNPAISGNTTANEAMEGCRL
jgi:hypothetical protein